MMNASSKLVTTIAFATKNAVHNKFNAGSLSLFMLSGQPSRWKSHHDMKVPDFNPYRRPCLRDPKKKSSATEDSRNNFTYLLATSGFIGAAYGAKATVLQYVLFMAASADVLALAKIEISLKDIPEGRSITFKWRGKPLFVFHRNEAQISEVRAVPMSELPDPQKDEDRVKRDDWLIILGVCTHLGCVPVFGAGDYNGFYCPCHGSHFDASGRTRKGPAPTNLEIPEYEFSADGTKVTVG